MDENKNPVFPKGERAPADYFTGTAWIQPVVPDDRMFNCVIGSVTFEPGSRNHWHTHPGGQILIVTDGIGAYQEKGKPQRVIRKGDIITIPPGVKHWHGASSESAMTHLAISTNTNIGIVTWMEAVTDEEYIS